MQLSKLKSFLKEQKLDFFYIANSDQFFSEYLPESDKRIEFVTGFSGSNAAVVFGQEKSYFFTDGRYLLQAEKQLDLNEFEIVDLGKKSVLSWLSGNLKSQQNIAFAANLVSVSFVNSLKKITENLVFLSENPVDKIWQNRPSKNLSKIFAVPENLSGISSLQKRKIICEKLNADALLITNPQDLCWLLNIRANDIEFNPLCLAYGLLYKNAEIDFFIDEKRCADVSLKNVNLIAPKQLSPHLQNLKIKKIELDFNITNYALYQNLSEFEVVNKPSIIELEKAQKNSAEIIAIKKAHEIDGLALTKFLFWLQDSLKKNQEITEISASEKLLELRKKHADFLYPSFATISGFAGNGAIIHYHATEKTNKKIAGNSLYLVDSGGQYFGKTMATTDITRTILVGAPSEDMIEDFTRVLKGHITLARAKFPFGTSGAQLDVLARNFLWQAKKDYAHGTGHGVGAFLAVHEGPIAISKRSHLPLQEGMILSNEPGFYKAGEYGIRIENLLLVEKLNEDFLGFKTISLAPIDASLINFKMLTYPEKKWLKEYHQEIFAKMKDGLNVEEKTWLEKIVKNFS